MLKFGRPIDLRSGRLNCILDGLHRDTPADLHLGATKLLLWLKFGDENNFLSFFSFFFRGGGSSYGAVQSYFESKPERRTDQFYIFCKQSEGFREEVYQPLTGSSKSLYKISGRFFYQI